MDHDMHMRRRLAGQPPTAQGRAGPDVAGGSRGEGADVVGGLAVVGVCGVWAVLPTGAMAALRDLIGVRNCERDEYYVYCQVCL